MKNIKVFLIIFAIGIILIIVGLIISILLAPAGYKNEIYCSSSAMCYTYDGFLLKYYEDEDETEEYLDYLTSTCIYNKFFNTCKEKILSWDKKKIYIQRDKNTIVGYYNVKKEIRRSKDEDIDLTGKAYKNNKLDLYFVSPRSVIVSGTKKSQEKCNYYISAYDFDDYTSLRYECPNKSYDKEDIRNTYTFDLKKDTINGFKKTTKEKLKRIDFSYYDEDYDYIIKDDYYIKGHFKNNHKNYSIDKEDVWFNEKEVKIQTSTYTTTSKIEIKEVNDKYILYDVKGYGGRYYYDLEKETICSYGTCYQKLDS